MRSRSLCFPLVPLVPLFFALLACTAGSGPVALSGPGPGSSESPGPSGDEDPGSDTRGDLKDPGAIANGNSGSSSGGGGSSGGSGNVSLGAECATLLAEYTEGVDFNCPDDPPKVSDYTGPCLRDSYIAAAITYCWGAYCYGAQGDAIKSQATEQCALSQICNALDLCSDTPVVGEPLECSTLELVSCDGAALSCPIECMF